MIRNGLPTRSGYPDSRNRRNDGTEVRSIDSMDIRRAVMRICHELATVFVDQIALYTVSRENSTICLELSYWVPLEHLESML